MIFSPVYRINPVRPAGPRSAIIIVEYNGRKNHNQRNLKERGHRPTTGPITISICSTTPSTRDRYGPFDDDSRRAEPGLGLGETHPGKKKARYENFLTLNYLVPLEQINKIPLLSRGGDPARGPRRSDGEAKKLIKATCARGLHREVPDKRHLPSHLIQRATWAHRPRTSSTPSAAISSRTRSGGYGRPSYSRSAEDLAHTAAPPADMQDRKMHKKLELKLGRDRCRDRRGT